jgi:serine phosphatase RsbU (regulator of sigma subunit)
VLGTQLASAPRASSPPPPHLADDAEIRRGGPGHAEQPDGATVAMNAQPRPARRLAAAICAIGVLLTGLSAWAAGRVDDSTEQRLLEVQTKQAATVLSTAIMLVQAPLTTALQVQPVAGLKDTAAFERFMSTSVGPDKTFVSASIWHRDGDRLTRLANVGAAPALAADAPKTQTYLRGAFDKPTFTVRSVTAGSRQLIVYVLADKESGFVVYGERPIPADRRAPVDRDSAFAELHYAIYLGPRTVDASLSTTDVDPSTLPLSGTTARATVPFGDTVLTLVASPRRHLGGTLSQRLPLVLLVGGLLLTLAAARTGQQLVRQRQVAEAHSSTITALYDRVETLYGQQRDLSEKLQRALLPRTIPDIPQLGIAAEYVAGAQGVEIGGDWYSIISLGDDRFAFVVGDVSGRGVDAVAVMAHARFTVRAYLAQGDSPVVALEKCSQQFDISFDGHITTVIVGVGSWRTGEITLASAGHPPPLLLTGETTEFVELSPGPPLGAGPSTFSPTTFTMSPGATLLCYTDGLIERRTESIDTGMHRLATVVEASAGQAVDVIVADVLAGLRSDDAPDDIAVLALRWEPVR